MNWETNSSNGISLQFMNDCQEGGSNGYGALRSKNFGLYGLRDDYIDDFEIKLQRKEGDR